MSKYSIAFTPKDKLEIVKDFVPENSHHYLNFLFNRKYKHNYSLKTIPLRGSFSGQWCRKLGEGVTIKLCLKENKYENLITLIHEIAHHENWLDNSYRYKSVKPHGVEWQTKFKELVKPVITTDIFPDRLCKLLKDYFNKPKIQATLSRNTEITKEFSKYSSSSKKEVGEIATFLSDLTYNDIFIFKGNKYQKKSIRRTSHDIVCLSSGKKYTLAGRAEVTKVEQ